MKMWMRNVQPRLATHDAPYADSRALENQLGRSQVSSLIDREINHLIFSGSST